MRRRRWAALASITLLAAVTGATLGYFVRLDMPSLRGLEDYAPPEMTRILARDGSRIASFAAEKRILLADRSIPQSFRHALLASEDSRFDEHTGVDPIGGARALAEALRQGRISQGASTLTMQLAGNLFLDRSQRTLRRKLQEALLALEIERRFSKQEILRMYCNQVHFGHGLYGLEAAARYYFDKPAPELTIGESATLVGLLPRPASYSPFRDMRRATERRNLVLHRMVAEGYLDPTDADRIGSEPIVLAERRESQQLAPYFNEHVRRLLQQDHGSTALYRGGLVVKTTLDPRLQQFANLAVEKGLRQLERRRGREPGATAEEEPRPQAALVAIEPSSGEVLALVGGFDFTRSEYDRVTQARRQTGSLFKPFVYAAALSQGWTLADSLLDQPTVFLDRRKPVPYQPENFSRRYYGTITLRTALEKSANIATVKLLQQIGYQPVVDTARRLGVRSRLRPYPSLALGAFELTLLEVTSAYGAFANQGLLMETHMIREVSDREGRTLRRSRPGVTEAVSPQVAYLMNQALSGVIQRGTAQVAGRSLEHTLAGKTGTTDDNSDAWFVGYSPQLVVGVWVGYDEPRSLGEDETGARAALPIWIEFMRRALADTPDRPFPVPPGISTVPIDPRTGLRPSGRADCRRPILEVFVEGSEPTRRCSRALHGKLVLPYPFHRYGLDARGSLMIPLDELEQLLDQEQDIRFRRRKPMLEAFTQEGIVRLPVTLLPPSEPTVELALDELADTAAWIGTDGRPAEVVWFNEKPLERNVTVNAR